MQHHNISIYRVFISHRYIRSAEYQRLVKMLSHAAELDPTWRWRNISIPREAPIMTKEEARMGDTYLKYIRHRLFSANVVLYIRRDDWLENDGSLYQELVEGTIPYRYRTSLPIISILPRGSDPGSLIYKAPGQQWTVRWNTHAIIQAIREHAIPASASDLRLTNIEKTERSRIIRALKSNKGRLSEAAGSLGISLSTLRRKRMNYLIR